MRTYSIPERQSSKRTEHGPRPGIITADSRIEANGTVNDAPSAAVVVRSRPIDGSNLGAVNNLLGGSRLPPFAPLPGPADQHYFQKELEPFPSDP